ncbi:MAG: AlkA N-terminal domain-containing protein [Streptosporangiaceae bacterium]
MTSFTAVTTTGIYCRPGCTARPRQDHTRLFPTAAAAEAAGYRACLRCRPYRGAPPSGGLSPELVCRAVRLILGGALDGQTEQDLGRGLGVSGRHLRRLFTEHLGCTPTQLARSARAHFARRLLDETDLPVSDLAFACGYGSVRQLSRDFRAIFRATPTELRARRRAADRNAADGGLELRLPYQPPLCWPAQLDFLAYRAIPGVERVTPGGYCRTVRIGGDPGVLEFRHGGPDFLLLRAHLPHWAGLIHIVARARAIFGLDADYEAARRHLGGDPVIGPLLARQPGLRPPGSWNLLETAAQVIISEAVGPERARDLIGSLVRCFGEEVAGLDMVGLTHLFPTAAALASGDLSRAGIPAGPAALLAALSQAVLSQAVLSQAVLSQAVLSQAAAGQAERFAAGTGLPSALLSIPGMTERSAQAIALRLGEPDACPAARPGSGPGEPGIPAEHADSATAGAWRPYRAFAAGYLGWSAPQADAGSADAGAADPSRSGGTSAGAASCHPASGTR